MPHSKPGPAVWYTTSEPPHCKSYLPEEPDLPVGEDNVLALGGGQLEPEVSHLRVHLPLALPLLHLLRLDVEETLLLAQRHKQIPKLGIYLAERKRRRKIFEPGPVQICKNVLHSKVREI